MNKLKKIGFIVLSAGTIILFSPIAIPAAIIGLACKGVVRAFNIGYEAI